ncbi:MAG TPA: Ig-like domain-containing protein, partial [Candidatus Limnocylindrales bacterium]|nr:Ig-like domain-containing protein [Candidatus Limnocylindrales bacterium]
MRGFERRPSTRSVITEGRPATALVLLVIAAFVATCGGPAPSAPANGSGGPAATQVAGGTPEAPGSTPASPGTSPEPPEGAWTRGVEIPPIEPVASFEATAATVAGVLTDTAFRLTPLDGSDPLDVADRLTAEPAVDVVVASSGGTALVTPVAPLRQGQRYRFSLTAPDGTVQGSWAVQAVGPLAVGATTPGDGSTKVPRNTGIEVTFNQYGVAMADAERFISVAPAVAGHLEQAGKTIAFVPEDRLAAATLYTLTVRHGLPLAGTPMTLEKDVVVRFETEGDSPSGVHLDPSRLWEARPGQRAEIPVRVERWWPDEEEQLPIPMPKRVAVTVHRLPDVEGAVKAWRAIALAPGWTQLSGVAPVATGPLPLMVDTGLPLRLVDRENDSLTIVRLPGALPAGWYVVTISYEKVPQQLVLQVTDLAVYTVVTSTRSLAWVNDLRTGEPVRGATAAIAGKRIGTTGSDGIVVGRTPASVVNGDAEEQGPVLVVRKGGRAVFVPSGERQCEKCAGDRGGASDPGSAWWIVFGPDRYEYRPTDTINAWGVLRARRSGDVPDQVEVVLTTWSDESATATQIASLRATPDRNGAFLVQVPVKDLPYGEYRLILRTGASDVAERGINVTVIEKPAWTIRLGTARHAVVSGSDVLVTADAAFFEGTPVAGAQVVLDASDETTPLTVDAGGSGTAAVTLRAGGSESDGGQWDIARIGGRPALPEEGEIRGSTWVAVFRADVILRNTATVDGKRLVLSGSVHDVAYERFETAGIDWLGDVDPYGPAHAGAKVRVTVVEEITTRHKTGTEYDFITKRTVPVYGESMRRVSLGTKTVTADAQGRYRVAWPVKGGNRAYMASVRTTDDAGRATATEDWATAGARATDPTDTPWLDGWYREAGWSVGDRVPFTFSGGRAAGSPATYLWTSTRAGLRSWDLTSGPRWSTRFGAADVPGFTVQAVRFNGKAYEAVQGEAPVSFRLADRALDIAVTADRDRYAPGERATLAIRTTDPAGDPVAASVYVGVVDEKLVSMGLVDASDPLYALYGEVGSGLIGVGWTHRDPRPEGGAEGGDTTGGGSGGDGRTDFRDWLVAKMVRTGSDGRATLSFDLSDDLTSWHAYASGVSHSLLAGMGDAVLPVSLSFFAELTVAETYLAADQPSVAVRAYGGGLAADDAVTFTVSSDTLPLAPVVVRATAFTATEVALPPLTVGTHRLRIEAVSGSGDGALRDVMTRTFRVITSRTGQASVTYAPLEGPTAVAGGSGFTTLVLGDAGRGRVIPVLTELAGEDLVRGDRALAAAIATRVLRDTFGIEPSGPALDADLSRFQPDTAYSLFAYGSDELELSALAALAGEPRVRTMAGYFDSRQATTREERIWTLVGQAAYGAPVLGEIAAFAALDNLAIDEAVALALAAVTAGDEATAERLLRAILLEAGERQGPWVRIVSPAGRDPSIVLTARLAIVAASLGEPVAAEMDAYLEVHPPKTTLVELERALAAAGWVRRLPASDAVAALTVDGKRTELRIDGSRPVTVVLTPAQAPGAMLEPVSGSVLVTTRSEQPLDPASLTAPDGQEITRTVSPAGTIALTDAVVVTLRVRLAAPEEPTCWAVTELVPSGLVPVTRHGWEGGEDEEDGDLPSDRIEAPWRVTG